MPNSWAATRSMKKRWFIFAVSSAPALHVSAAVPTKASMALRQRVSGKSSPMHRAMVQMRRATPMIFSYSQISHFLRCPRSYRYRYLDGWQEKETRAGMIFGRCFEKALAAFFLGQDCGATLFAEWSSYRDVGLGFKNGENWDRLYHQGMHLLEPFARDNRIRISDPQQNLQIKIQRDLPNGNEFVAYLDAIGELDGVRSVIDWK